VSTGTAIQFFGVYLCRIADDTIVEDWDIFDALPALSQLGLELRPATMHGRGGPCSAGPPTITASSVHGFNRLLYKVTKNVSYRQFRGGL
jgi:hypothetical protein